MYPMTLLCDLARKHETDKGGQHYRYGGGDADTNHAYTPVYHSLFGEHRSDVRHVLEIGVHQGSSLRMWKEYFPHARIIGLDTNADCLRHSEDRIKVIIADQNNPDDLRVAMKIASRGFFNIDFDLIIDDGSHERDHQITSMQVLLPYLTRLGYYIIEDLGIGPRESLSRLDDAVPKGYRGEAIMITGGLGPKVQPHEWLYVIRRAAAAS